ncbi:hypothetical protein H632_c1887p0 [Helicosporidium sp. ATCC 50920]|nr:hypothetical protein H632_c1887p0 [Helicosporidium sp. ATCC 50920]|eukprot:KDD73727.1 hypothetical protein H632_c1887p0 [Helicosporidium sp. ATCC 50920]
MSLVRAPTGCRPSLVGSAPVALHATPYGGRKFARAIKSVVYSAAPTLPASGSWSAEGVAPPARGAHFLHLDDFSREEIVGMLKTAKDAKARLKNNDKSYRPFAGKSMVMIFTKPSMRTRVSFETVRIDGGGRQL